MGKKAAGSGGFSSRVSNFWYYHKWKVFTAVFAAVILAVAFLQWSTRPRADVSLILDMNASASPLLVEDMEEIISAYCKDNNDDQRCVVQIIDVSFPDGSNQLGASQTTKLQGEMQRGKTRVYICDEDRFQKLDEMGVPGQHTFFPDLDGKALNLKDTSIMHQIRQRGHEVPDLYLVLMESPENESLMEVQKQAEALVKTLLDN